MRTPRFAIANRGDLRFEREVYPLCQNAMRALTSSGVVERFRREEASRPSSDWLVFKNQEGAGFAVWLDGSSEYASPLQRSLRFVRQAHALVKGLGSHHVLPCALSLDRAPPSSWEVWRIDGVTTSMWCASSNPVVSVPIRRVEAQREPCARLRMFGSIEGVTELAVGVQVECGTIDARIPEIGVRARGVWREGAMTMEIETCGEIAEQHIPGVRLDLGEIEMRLSDLVGLRPGAVINLGDVAFERCFVRLGATVLAEGRFRHSDGKLLLTIESVL